MKMKSDTAPGCGGVPEQGNMIKMHGGCDCSLWHVVVMQGNKYQHVRFIVHYSLDEISGFESYSLQANAFIWVRIDFLCKILHFELCLGANLLNLQKPKDVSYWENAFKTFKHYISEYTFSSALGKVSWKNWHNGAMSGKLPFTRADMMQPSPNLLKIKKLEQYA